MNRECLLTEFELQLAAWRAGGRKPSVRSVAEGCGISRQSVYRSHQCVVAKIAELSDPQKRERDVALKVDLLRERLKREVEKVGILTTLCGELAAALHDAREELAFAHSTVERLRMKKGRG